MAFIIDTNCILRLAEKHNPQRTLVLKNLELLWKSSEIVFYTPQILAEFWNVCTRPATARGGLGLTVEQTERKVKIIEKHFRLLPDSRKTFDEWRRLVFDYKIKGVQVHDAKIAASMISHNISHLLTFNDRDFRRFSMITAVNPNNTQ